MSNKKVDFLICYEHVNREAENDALIKHELEKRGYSCDIIQYAGPDMYKYAGGKARVVLTPWLRFNENVYYYLNFADKKRKLVNLQWEQVYSIQGLKSGAVSIGEQAKKGVHLCWGKNSRDRLIEYGVPEKNLFITGAIQQDYGREIFSDYYKSRNDIAEEYKLDSSKNWVLFVSSFAFANKKQESLDFHAAKYGDYIYHVHDLHEASQEKTLEWIEELLKRSDCEFIYRPHPSEYVCAALNELESRYERLHVISDYSVKQWAKVSDFVDVWVSTSNAEIASLGVKCNIVRPLPVPEDYDTESMIGSDKITDLDSFIKSNTEKDGDKFFVETQLKSLGKYYDYSNEKSAYERTADALEKIINDDSYSADYSFTFKEKLQFRKKFISLKFISHLFDFLSRHGKNENFKFIPLNANIKNNLTKKTAMDRAAKEIEKKTVDYIISKEN